MLDWLIIGGGFHGTAISFYLTKRMGVARDRLRVLDPHPQPLALWHRFTHNTGMDYLRSTYVHHLHYDPWSLRTFAETRQGKPLATYIPRYNRPSLALINSYHDWLIGRYELAALRIQGRALGLTRNGGGWRVETDDGELRARRVVLAIGASEQRQTPAWAAGLNQVIHIFDPAFDRKALPDWSHLVIVGGGISAGQLALALSERQPGTVTLLMRHPLRISHFDADPCWVTSLCLASFHAEADPALRRQIIRQARATGSMPPDVAERVRLAGQTGQMALQVGEVTAAQAKQERIGWVTLQLSSGETIQADRVILATRFDLVRPGGEWMDEAIAVYGLPLAPDGYPLVDQALCWADGLYVTGPLAELEVGPVARNFIGARLAAERIGLAL
jgi:cation diffusion facilitator CzcD-associated flavoprotein CzcO